jgi:LysM repeat protein
METYYSYNYRNSQYSSRGNKVPKKKLFRFMILLVFVLMSFMFGALIDVFANSNEPVTVALAPEMTLVDVEQGDTLWSIAQTYAPSGTDVRDYINHIKKLNELRTATLQVGQILELP